MPRPRPLAHLALVALVVVAAACGGTKSAVTNTSAHLVRIAVIAPLKAGGIGPGRAIRDSVQLAVNEANARLAIPGWSIQVVAKDDGSDPATGEQAATALAADPSVIGVVGTYDSAVAWRAEPVLNRAGIAMISPGNTDPSLTLGAEDAKPQRQFTTYFRLIASNAREAPAMARFARVHLHARTAAVVSETRSASRMLADDIGASFTVAGGRVVLDTTVADNTTQFRDVAQSIERRDPDVIFFAGNVKSGAALRSAVPSATPLLGGDGIRDDGYVHAAGSAAEGDFAVVPGGSTANTSASSLYRLEYAAARFVDPPTDFGPYAFDAANLLIKATAQALLAEPSITPNVRGEIVSDVQAAQVDGASGRVAFDAYGDNTGAVLTVYRVTNGRWLPIFSSGSG